jgi:predicted small lipoprotein YifL
VPEPHRLLPRLAIFAALVAALALAGCGRKGPLDPPPASLTDKHPAEGAAASKAARDQALKDAEKRNPLNVLLN